MNGGAMARLRMFGWRLHRGLASVLAMAVFVGPLLVLTATERVVHAAIVEPSSDVTLEVQVDARISEAADLRRWVDEEARQAIASWPSGPMRRGNVRIAIVGALYDYKVTITALRDGDVMGKADAWACECSTEELLETLRGKLPKVAGWLEVVEEAEPVEVTPEPAAAPEPVRVEDDGRRRTRGRLGPSGAAGVVLMTVGATGLATGVAFLVVGDKDLTTDAQYVRSLDFVAPGRLMAVSGGGLLLTGAVLYLLRNRINPERRKGIGTLAPALDARGGAHITVTGRF